MTLTDTTGTRCVMCGQLILDGHAFRWIQVQDENTQRMIRIPMHPKCAERYESMTGVHTVIYE